MGESSVAAPGRPGPRTSLGGKGQDFLPRFAGRPFLALPMTSRPDGSVASPAGPTSDAASPPLSKVESAKAQLCGLDLEPRLAQLAAAGWDQLDEATLNALPAVAASGKPASIWLAAQLIEDGLLVVPAGPKVVRWLPPMNLTEAHASEALQIFHNTLNRIIE